MWSLFLKHGISEVSYKCSMRLLHFGWTRIKACLSTLQPLHSLSLSQQRLFDRPCLLAAYSPIKDPKGTTMKTSGSPLFTQILPFWYLAPQILDPSSSLNSELFISGSSAEWYHWSLLWKLYTGLICVFSIFWGIMVLLSLLSTA